MSYEVFFEINQSPLIDEHVTYEYTLYKRAQLSQSSVIGAAIN